MTVNEWEKGIATEKGVVDRSEFGGINGQHGENIRNYQLNGHGVRYDSAKDALPPLGSDIVVRMDYVSPFHVSKTMNVISDTVWGKIGEIFETSACSRYDKLRVFRCFSTRWRLRGSHVKKSIGWFPLPGFRVTTNTFDVVAESSHDFEGPRLEAFVACFNRVWERSEAIAPIYDRSLFTASEARRLRHRLGWLNVFAITRVGTWTTTSARASPSTSRSTSSAWSRGAC